MKSFRVLANTNKHKSITVHPSWLNQLSITPSLPLTVRFGISQSRVELQTDPHLKLDEIELSKDIIDHFRLPLAPLYQWHVQDFQLSIGPYIGILVCGEHQLLARRIDSLSSYIKDYSTIQGAILAFSLEGVNIEEHKIKGFMYDPIQQTWKEGTYRYPAALFSIVEVSLTGRWEEFQAVMQHFSAILGNRIYNYPTFNKWEMHQWLSKYPAIKGHLPDTVQYESPMKLYQMLKKHRRVYVKPILGRLGLGIVECSIGPYGVTVRFRNHGGNQQHLLATPDHFRDFANTFFSPTDYLIQQAIPLLTISRRLVDFRLMLVKDEHGTWKNAGLFGRYGAKKSIVSNITAGGHAEWGNTTLKKLLGINQPSVKKWKKKMITLAVKASRAMEAYGVQYGNLGLDIAIDRKRNIWLLEINNQNPDHYIAKFAGKEEMLLKARRANMLYCKRLAGFYE